MVEEFKVGVVGVGYVGLVTGACLAHLGHRVTCVDNEEEKVRNLNRGRIPIFEPHLEEMVSQGVEKDRLSFTTELPEMVNGADVVFIAVDTPQSEDGSANLSSVATVARSIGRALAESHREAPLVVVNKSTVPVGSGDYVSMLVQEGAEEGGDGSVDFRVVSNPEFLREGSAVYDSLFPDRIVLGAEGRDALDTMRALYQPIIEQSFPTEMDPRPRVAVPFVTTDLASAEMIKYAANAFLATKISFINEVANICELVGADVGSVAAGIGLDERIGPRFLNAGIGWGGSCFPKDVTALRSIAREYDYEPALLDAVVTVNQRQRKRIIAKLQRDLHTLKGKRVALLGLAFKPNTDDLREAPSLEIAQALDSVGARVVGYDPIAGKAATSRVPDLKVVFDLYEALEGAHAAVLVTEWEEIRNLHLERAASLMEQPKLIVDGRNVLDSAAAVAEGLLYRGFGRGS
ncbi:MAG: UDP-glucose/GDP-mannose dehydrogenase family protein [Actinomycetota bacterium]|nr:UDP-glucose/GDP-mannose dehydrogenase family protein [Actinomycetota bacterium]